MLDGAWWPRGRELAVEIPLLTADFAQRGLQVASVTYHPSTWQVAPSKLRVNGHRIQLSAVREIDPALLIVRTAQDEAIDLLVIPAETNPAVAARAMALAVSPLTQLTPTALLAAAGLS